MGEDQRLVARLESQCGTMAGVGGAVCRRIGSARMDSASRRAQVWRPSKYRDGLPDTRASAALAVTALRQ